MELADKKYNLPPGTMYSLAGTESTFNTAAVSRNKKTGKILAEGMFQLSPEYAADINRFNVLQSAPVAAAKIRQYADRFGSVEKGLHAYNMGETRYARRLRKGKGLFTETSIHAANRKLYMDEYKKNKEVAKPAHEMKY